MGSGTRNGLQILTGRGTCFFSFFYTHHILINLYMLADPISSQRTKKVEMLRLRNNTLRDNRSQLLGYLIIK